MVSVITYRDERRLFAVIGAVIVAALLALLQLDFARSGRTSPLTVTVTAVSTYLQLAIATVVGGVRGGGRRDRGHARAWRPTTPACGPRTARCAAATTSCKSGWRAMPAALDLERARLAHPDGVPATVIGYDPEASTHLLTIDVGAKDHVHRDDGVVGGEGVVGRIVEVDPLSSKVLLVTDATSKLPAVVQHGRWWAIAVGTSTRLKLQYVSQDAKLRLGDRVVTGEGRSFHAGVLIGRITRVEPAAAGALDQTAIVQPATDLSALSRVLVLPS